MRADFLCGWHSLAFANSFINCEGVDLRGRALHSEEYGTVYSYALCSQRAVIIPLGPLLLRKGVISFCWPYYSVGRFPSTWVQGLFPLKAAIYPFEDALNGAEY